MEYTHRQIITATWVCHGIICYASPACTERNSLYHHLKTRGSAGAWGLCWTDCFNIRLFSSVVTVGVRPVRLRFKSILSSRNVLTLRAMKFWDSVGESSCCSPVQAELAAKFNALLSQQFHRNDRLDTEHYLLNRPYGRVTQSDI